MKIIPFAAAGLAVAAAAPIAPLFSTAQAQRVVVAGGPAGPGWYRYHDRRWRRGWDGPRYYAGAGPHRGWYNWNNRYYRNCSYRWAHHRRRVWRCW